MNSEELAKALRERLDGDGLGLIALGRVGDYNALAPAVYALPDLGSPTHAVLLIGHGREVWSPFVRARRASPALQRDPNPFDRWTSERIVDAVRSTLPPGLRAELRFVWEGPPRLVAMQKLAVSVGLASLGPSGLTVDASHGPWLAFRAALVVAVETSGSAARAPDLCANCAEKPCVAALERAQAGTPLSPSHKVAIQPQWKRWLDVRDACPIGRAARYSDPQIRYHYGRDPRALDEEA